MTLSTQSGAGPSSSKLEPTLNEEGLPFVDLNEPIETQDEPIESNGKGVVLPFAPKKDSKEDRRAWLEATLRDIEADDYVEVPTGKHSAPHGITREMIAKSKHARVASADRPAPTRSVLKHNASGASTPQRFGASGMRKGFLNMNPSSPAAEHSSDPIDKIVWAADEPMSASTSSLGSVGDYIRSNGSGTDDGRSARDAIHRPLTGNPRKKKTVRIQSPERRKEASSSTRNQLQDSQRRPKNIIDRDEDSNEAEARMIVDLLGVEAIQGHPQYESIKAKLEKERRIPASASAPTASSSSQAIPSAEPAVRENVVERDPSVSTSTRSSKKAVGGIWKRGFLREVPPPPGPQYSHGISALERASRNDDSVLERDLHSGGKTVLPHARPSKAFAARLHARKEGFELDDDSSQQEYGASTTSKVRFGENGEGHLAVSVGEAATEARGKANTERISDGETLDGDIKPDEFNAVDDQMAAMGLNVHDEYLDDDQIEALGYFPDEEADPDIGFDSDDLVEAYPHFDSEATDIADINLRNEYERIKAHLQQKNSLDPTLLREVNETETYSIGESDVSLADDELDKSHSSRFKREKLHRTLMSRPAVSRELGNSGKATSVKNAGPSMIIPALVDVRYPKPLGDGSIPMKAHEIELDGRSDEEDVRLEDLMRTRLADLNPVAQSVASSSERAEDQPPQVVTAFRRGAETQDGKRKKKTSLFKARMQHAMEED